MLAIGFLVWEFIIFILHKFPFFKATVILEADMTAVAFLTVIGKKLSTELWASSGVVITLNTYSPTAKLETVKTLSLKLFLASV